MAANTRRAPIPRPGGRPDPRALFEEMAVLACAIARGQPPGRSEAMTYSATRDALLASDIADMLPGFLLQCHSVHRLRDFITLYDPECEMREAFMTRAFDRCRAAIVSTRRGTPGGGVVDPQEWML